MSKQMKLMVLLSLFFVFFSFSPSLYEIYSRNKLPAEREFVLEHNYMFDYNFYLSRIREGQEGRWTVVEKYFNEPHNGSLLQIFYLFLGKIGGLMKLPPPAIYHAARLIFGFLLLYAVAIYAVKLFPGWWPTVAFLLVVTSGSWPILTKVGNFWRFATYMGYWSVIDSLQRITFIPHILFGQIGLLLLVWKFGGDNKSLRLLKLLMWGLAGFLVGIVFPPTLIIIYVFTGVLSVLEIVTELKLDKSFEPFKKWFMDKGFPRFAFCLLSVSSLIYLNLMLRIPPWSALSLFDIQHRIPIPYKEYFLALGPVLPLGLVGLILALIKKEKKLYPAISWVVAIFLLFRIFENIPEQSPSRFTEAAIYIPLGMLATYFFSYLIKLRYLRRVAMGGIILMIFMGLGVMVSMVGWLTDQVRWKREATYPVPIGAQLAYPLKDFMEGIRFLRDHTDKNSVVLTYVTAGNFIPAYAGNFVYIGHANTPDEDTKEKIAARFFKGEMTMGEARDFLIKNHISYIYFGVQEKELGNIGELSHIYPIITPIYNYDRVIIYKIG